MLNITQKIHSSILAVCPISGVSIGSYLDKSTWRIDFSSAATPAQKLAAQSVIDSFDAAGEIAKDNAQQLADSNDTAAAKADGAVAAFLSMTPAQAAAWVETNVNTFADQKAFDKTIAKILCVLARRL